MRFTGMEGIEAIKKIFKTKINLKNIDKILLLSKTILEFEIRLLFITANSVEGLKG